MKVAELREALEERGLASDGLKAELQARLANHLLASPGPCEYLKLVQDAICSLDEKTGSSQQAIENFVMHKKTDDYDNKAFLDALKTGIADGYFVEQKEGGYLIPGRSEDQITQIWAKTGYATIPGVTTFMNFWSVAFVVCAAYLWLG